MVLARRGDSAGATRPGISRAARMTAAIIVVFAGVSALVGVQPSPASAAPRSEAVPAASVAPAWCGGLVCLPVAGSLARGFEAPDSPWGAGHRGVKLAIAETAAVYAPAAGVVHHAGAVGGVVWVSVDHGEGLLTSYGPVTPAVARGQSVARGQVIGHLSGDDLLHWGLRRHGAYLDPFVHGVPRVSLVGPGGVTVQRVDAH